MALMIEVGMDWIDDSHSRLACINENNTPALHPPQVSTETQHQFIDSPLRLETEQGLVAETGQCQNLKVLRDHHGFPYGWGDLQIDGFFNGRSH